MNLFKITHDYLYELNKFVLSRNKLDRSSQTNNYFTKKVALGKSNDFNTPKDWIAIDHYHLNCSVDLKCNYTLPFRGNLIDALYEFLTFKHLTLGKAKSTLKEVFKVLKPTGKFGIELPNFQIMIRAFVNKSEEYIKHNCQLRNTLITMSNYSKKYRDVQLEFLGIDLNYIKNPPFFQIPMYSTKEESNQKKEDLNLDEIYEWCFSLQTPNHYKTADYKTYFYPAKMKQMLETAGFKSASNVGSNNGMGIEVEEPRHIFFSMCMKVEI